MGDSNDVSQVNTQVNTQVYTQVWTHEHGILLKNENNLMWLCSTDRSMCTVDCDCVLEKLFFIRVQPKYKY